MTRFGAALACSNTGFMTKAGAEHETRQRLLVGFKIRDRLAGKPRRHSGLSDGRRDAQDQARIERRWDQRGRPEHCHLAAISAGHDVRGGLSRASFANASTAASFMLSSMERAPTSSAPRKMYGKHRTLLT